MAKRKTVDADGVWRPKKLKIEYTDEKLTAASGLGRWRLRTTPTACPNCTSGTASHSERLAVFKMGSSHVVTDSQVKFEKLLISELNPLFPE
jgi:hypothetical protein